MLDIKAYKKVFKYLSTWLVRKLITIKARIVCPDYKTTRNKTHKVIGVTNIFQQMYRSRNLCTVVIVDPPFKWRGMSHETCWRRDVGKRKISVNLELGWTGHAEKQNVLTRAVGSQPVCCDPFGNSLSPKIFTLQVMIHKSSKIIVLKSQWK